MSSARNALKKEAGINYSDFEPPLSELHASKILKDYRSGRLDRITEFLSEHYKNQNVATFSYLVETGTTATGRYAVRETTYGSGRIEITLEE
jgi:hypothetical protein